MWVQAVVVLRAEFPQEVIDDGRCVFLHGTQLREWLCKRPNRVGEQDLAELAAAVSVIASRQAYDDVETLAVSG